MKTELIIIGAIVLTGIIYFVQRTNNNKDPMILVAQQIQFEQLESVMTQLLEGKLEYNFFGITSDGIDCIYFVENNKKINIEFEVMTDEQKPYIEKLTEFAKIKGFHVSKTTYGNQPQYTELREAPVYKIELNCKKEEAVKIGIEIMKTVFNKNDNTRFDVVP